MLSSVLPMPFSAPPSTPTSSTLLITLLSSIIILAMPFTTTTTFPILTTIQPTLQLQQPLQHSFELPILIAISIIAIITTQLQFFASLTPLLSTYWLALPPIIECVIISGALRSNCYWLMLGSCDLICCGNLRLYRLHHLKRRSQC